MDDEKAPLRAVHGDAPPGRKAAKAPRKPAAKPPAGKEAKTMKLTITFDVDNVWKAKAYALGQSKAVGKILSVSDVINQLVADNCTRYVLSDREKQGQGGEGDQAAAG